MCAIYGLYAYRIRVPTVDPAELCATRDHMAARGPDGEGAWISPDGRVGLGHRRLAIIDLSPAAAQPLPADLVQRPKTGFTTPIARWLERLPASGRERLAPGAHWSRHWALQVMEKETRPQMHDGRLARGCLTLLCARRSEAGTVQAR